MLTSQAVKELAFSAGFDLCGITGPEPIPKAQRVFFKWIEHGFHGEMEWLAKNPEARTDPARLLREVRSLIMLGLNYYQPDSADVPRGSGRVSKYARGRDYHKVFEKGMKRLTERMKERADDPACVFLSYVDYGPMLERAYAEKAGLGFIGKNSMLINRDFGSWILLGEILTSLELDRDDASVVDHGSCGECRACIEACPTGAIIADRTVKATKCLSYLTIERPSRIPRGFARQLESGIFGCDICQDVCPLNSRAIMTRHDDMRPERGVGEFVDANRIVNMTSREEFLELTAGTPLTRPRLDGLQRNARIVLENQTRHEESE